MIFSVTLIMILWRTLYYLWSSNV